MHIEVEQEFDVLMADTKQTIINAKKRIEGNINLYLVFV